MTIDASWIVFAIIGALTGGAGWYIGRSSSKPAVPVLTSVVGSGTNPIDIQSIIESVFEVIKTAQDITAAQQDTAHTQATAAADNINPPQVINEPSPIRHTTLPPIVGGVDSVAVTNSNAAIAELAKMATQLLHKK